MHAHLIHHKGTIYNTYMGAFKAIGNRYLYIIMSRHILKNIFDSDNGRCYKFVVWRPEINVGSKYENVSTTTKMSKVGMIYLPTYYINILFLS